MQRLACDGMLESQLSSMQTEAGGRSAIKTVAHDGASQPQMMGTMHAQLMGAPRMGRECDERVLMTWLKSDGLEGWRQ